MQLIEYGKKIIQRRRQFIDELNEIVFQIHKNISGEREELILKYAGEHESFSRSEIDALLKTSPATSNRILKKLLAENKLLARGNGKALRYFIERR